MGAKVATLILSFLLLQNVMFAQSYDFESNRNDFWVTGSSAELSTDRYKQGAKSMCWTWSGGDARLSYLNSSVLRTAKGMTLWIYNETPCDKPLKFSFVTSGTNAPYWFNFGLDYKGWRACWIAFDDMEGEKGSRSSLSRLNIAPPEGLGSGRLYFDRWSFVSSVTDRPTPDKQIPDNGEISQPFKDHWTRLWLWEQYEYDVPVAQSISAQEQADLATLENRLTAHWAGSPGAAAGAFSSAEAIYNAAQITRSGSNIYGAPFVNNDEKSSGDISWAQVGAMLAGYAVAYHHGYNRATAESRFNDVFDYMLDQGFAYGSSMGTNHHYGYDTRDYPKAMWLMRESLASSGRYGDAFKTVEYWSGLPVTRVAQRVVWPDGIVDAWNTLSMFKLTAAMMSATPAGRLRAMQCFTRWMSASTEFSPGTVGGIKPDGTHFHHGGLYPAYAKDAFAGLNPYFELIQGTSFVLTPDARKNLKLTMQTMRNYSNLAEWGIGVCGRHPFTNVAVASGAIQCMGNLARMGDLSGNGDAVDRELAADFLRLNSGVTGDLKTYFEGLSIAKASAPQGFWAYNHACLGVLRRDGWMVSLKGYNTDVWGSEIYASDNRYGRYQSYGSIQIFAGGNPVSNAGSGYRQAGWDWNRLPGATTLHLPNARLNSPNSGSLMEKSTENFSGASSLLGRYGVFATKIKEKSRTNFTPSFVARKSAFCFDNHIVCIGSGISNTNTTDSTETTLFQLSALQPDAVKINGQSYAEFPFDKTIRSGSLTHLVDNQNIEYYIPAQQTIRVQKGTQQSNDNKSKAATSGDFAVAYLQHGVSPSNAAYEYMIHILPDDAERSAIQSGGLPYVVHSRDNTAHVVTDNATGITAYACFEKYTPANDMFVTSVDAECLLMINKRHEDTLQVSVADPNLNIETKDYTTSDESRPLYKEIKLKGGFIPLVDDENIYYDATAQATTLRVKVVLGLPVEFTLVKGTGKSYTSTPKRQKEGLLVALYPNPTQGNIAVSFPETMSGDFSVQIFSAGGELVKFIPGQPVATFVPVDIAALLPGIYYFNIRASNGRCSTRTVVKY